MGGGERGKGDVRMNMYLHASTRWDQKRDTFGIEEDLLYYAFVDSLSKDGCDDIRSSLACKKIGKSG